LRITWSPLAIDRAEKAASYIADDKPDAAVRWIEGLFKAVDRLAKLPYSGRKVPEIGTSEYREIIYRAHRVIYRVGDNAVSILTVRHSKQLLDPEELLVR